MVELMCNGTFEDKEPNEAMEYLDLLAENAQNQDTTDTYEAPSKTQPHTSSGGIDCASKVSLSLLFYICIYCFYLGFL